MFKKPELNNTQIVDAINVAFSGLQSPKNQNYQGQKVYSQQRPGTQGGIATHHTNISPTSMASNPDQLNNSGPANFVGVGSQNIDERGNVADVAMRVKKYKHNQYAKNQQSSGHIMI